MRKVPGPRCWRAGESWRSARDGSRPISRGERAIARSARNGERLIIGERECILITKSTSPQTAKFLQQAESRDDCAAYSRDRRLTTSGRPASWRRQCEFTPSRGEGGGLIYTFIHFRYKSCDLYTLYSRNLTCFSWHRTHHKFRYLIKSHPRIYTHRYLSAHLNVW